MKATNKSVLTRSINAARKAAEQRVEAAVQANKQHGDDKAPLRKPRTATNFSSGNQYVKAWSRHAIAAADMDYNAVLREVVAPCFDGKLPTDNIEAYMVGALPGALRILFMGDDGKQPGLSVGVARAIVAMASGELDRKELTTAGLTVPAKIGATYSAKVLRWATQFGIATMAKHGRRNVYRVDSSHPFLAAVRAAA